jgi:MFS family permease
MRINRSWLRQQLSLAHPWLLAEPALQPSLRAFWFDALFITLGVSFIDPYVSLYALGMGATTTQIGLLASVPGILALTGSLLGSRFAYWLGSNKKAAWLGNRIFYQFFSFLFVLLPWLVKSNGIVYALIFAVSLRALLSNLGAPGWAAMAAAITPERLRGRYFSSRQMIGLVSTLIGVPVAGFLIARFGGYPTGYQLGFFLAVITFSGCVYWFHRITEPPIVGQAPVARKTTGSWWRSGNFLRFSAATFLWSMSASLAGPYYPVYMTRTLHLDASAIGLLTTVATAGQLLSLPYLGMLHDRRGSRWLSGIVTLAAAPVAWSWLIVRSAWHLVPIQLLTGVTQAGLILGVFNLMLRCVPPDQEITRYTGFYYALAAAANITGPLLGSVLFQHYGLAGTVVVSGCGSLLAALIYLFVVKDTALPEVQDRS